ncbi:MAG: type III-B CRISPR module RAMP protein Cmr4 [Phaeodactylibacter sp.]|nr:type III-B CRISPR module RAMP protein Cmr4 [Phaeodactylibacter sp.]
MYRTAHPLFLICETPLHAGSGSDLGIIDLPIQRERHTGFPKIEGSSLKGSIREAVERKVKPDPTKEWEFKNYDGDDVKIHRVFGFDDGSLKPGKNGQRGEKERLKDHFKRGNEYETSFAGSISFSDARLLLFPVKSMKGVFAWITCPKVLHQLKKDMDMAGKRGITIPEGINLVAPGNQVSISVQGQRKVLLEEYAFDVQEEQSLIPFGQWLSDNIFYDADQFWKEKIKTDIVVLANDEFKDFVNLSTEVITRTKIDNDTGTVANGQLFTEEYLPAESVLYSLVLAAPEFTSKEDRIDENEVISFVQDQLPEIIQAGANATLGKGLLRTKLITNQKA